MTGPFVEDYRRVRGWCRPMLPIGQRQPYMRNNRHEAQRACRLLAAASGFHVGVTGLNEVIGAREGYTV